MYEGKILDGRNRYMACKLIDVEPQFTTLHNIDPLQYVISTNLKRRHLDTSQRGMIAAKLANMPVGRNWESNSPNLVNNISVEEAAKMLNVSTGIVTTAKEIIRDHPEEVEAIESGKETVSAVVKRTRKQDQIKKRSDVAKTIETKDENLHLGSCVDVLKTLESNSVDCVVMDPPYAISYKDSRESFNPEFEDNPEIILPMLKECFKELNRVCKSNAHIYCFFGMSEYTNFYNLLNDEFGEKVEKIPIIWKKNNHTMCDFNKRYALLYEPIFFISNKERNLTNKISRNIIEFDIPMNKLHKTQKPLDLCEYLISNSTVEGEVVLDPFMGSGTSCLAAKKLKRRYIGIEIDPDIYNIAIERLKV